MADAADYVAAAGDGVSNNVYIDYNHGDDDGDDNAGDTDDDDDIYKKKTAVRCPFASLLLKWQWHYYCLVSRTKVGGDGPEHLRSSVEFLNDFC